MPTTFAHDLFGKQVYRKLPNEIQRILKRNRDLFRIGLHGPDILFYFMYSKNPISAYGVRLHNTPAKGFFEEKLKLARKTKDEQLLAYLLGFGCHFCLDSTCHPYVIRMAKEKRITHTLLEKEMDRELKLESKIDPYRYYPSDAVVPKYAYAKVMHRAFPKIPTICLWISMHMMKFLTNLMVNDDHSKKRNLANRVTSIFGKRANEFVIDYIMREECMESDWQYVERAIEYYDRALETAPVQIAELYGLYIEKKQLNNMWDRTYNI